MYTLNENALDYCSRISYIAFKAQYITIECKLSFVKKLPFKIFSRNLHSISTQYMVYITMVNKTYYNTVKEFKKNFLTLKYAYKDEEMQPSNFIVNVVIIYVIHVTTTVLENIITYIALHFQDACIDIELQSKQLYFLWKLTYVQSSKTVEVVTFTKNVVFFLFFVFLMQHNH